MRRREPGPAPDVFEAFADRVDVPEERRRAIPPVRALARSAGLTLGLMLLTSLGFIGGAWLAAQRTPDLAYTTVIWEGVVVLAWCVLWGLLAGASALAVGVVAVALPWVRRQRAGQRPS
ncbi:hypothetical protein [uncultured Phycicoccus sp.]|uniref:hypothetical protein n=1 Tax=uncultured Phycicoccus sp. TaxID=661422 RepID=UPI00262BDDE8|nr:hypothetical protein [uncultured Phycicoccus sp.]